MSERKKRLCVIIGPALSLLLLRKQWLYWIENGWEVDCIAGPGEVEHGRVRAMGVRSFPIPIERQPSPLKDIMSLIRIWWVLLKNRYDILHISTPKAALLGAIAGRLSFHRHLYYLVRGRAYEDMVGLKRRLMNLCEWLTCRLSSVVVPVSRELGQFLVSDRACSNKKLRYIGIGSSAGVDLERFTRTPELVKTGSELRHDLEIQPDDIVIMFVGRLRRDKGVNELLYVYNRLADKYDHIHLVLVGSFEKQDALQVESQRILKECDRIHHVEWCENPAPYYALSNIVVLPSYREGFPNVPLEAAAMSLPVITNDVIGCRESIIHEQTGILVPKEDRSALENALERLINDEKLRIEMGKTGRRRIEESFRQDILFQGTLGIFDSMLSKAVKPTISTDEQIK